MVKHKCKPWACAESFPTDPCGKGHAGQVYRNRTDGANTIYVKCHLSTAAQCLEHGEVVEHASGGLAMDGPEPFGVRLLAEHRLDLRRLKGCAPVDGKRPHVQSESARVVYQAVAEFSVRQNEAGFRMHRQLGSHHVVGQRA